MENQNGFLVLSTLKSIGKPISLSEVVRHLSNGNPEEIPRIKGDVKDTLHNGVKYGYLSRKNGKYFLKHQSVIDTPPPPKQKPREANVAVETESNKDESGNENNIDEQDDNGTEPSEPGNHGRRRRGKSRSKSRRRKRSRKSRR